MRTEPNAQSEYDLLTSRETAKILDIAPETLCRWRAEKKGPSFIKQGRWLRYRSDDVRTFLTAQV